MNLADSITKTDVPLSSIIQQYSEQYVTSNPADIPNFENYITAISSEYLISSKYPELRSVFRNIDESHYFVNKTERLTHRVLIVKITGIDLYYFLIKDDNSSCTCTAVYLAGELSVHLRLSCFNDTEE